MPSIKQRVCLMRAHKAICRYDNQLIESLADLEIDHIIPESLPTEELTALLKRLNKENLDINSYFNWFPVHRWCNNRKGDILLPDESLHYLLAIAASKEPAIRKEEAKFDRHARANDALGRVARQIELGTLSKEIAIAFLEGTSTISPSRGDPTILGFSINLSEATETTPQFDPPGEMLMRIEDEFDEIGINPSSLQTQLEESLKVLNALTVTSEAVQNNGETLSIRYAVWLLNLDLLPVKFPNAWRLLEVAPFSEIYQGQDASALMNRAVILRRNELIIDQDSPEPLPYRFCPNCASPKLRRSSHPCNDCGWGETF